MLLCLHVDSPHCAGSEMVTFEGQDSLKCCCNYFKPCPVYPSQTAHVHRERGMHVAQLPAKCRFQHVLISVLARASSRLLAAGR